MNDESIVHVLQPLEDVSGNGLDLLLVFDFTFSDIDLLFQPLGVFDELQHTYDLRVVLRVLDQLHDIARAELRLDDALKSSLM